MYILIYYSFNNNIHYSIYYTAIAEYSLIYQHYKYTYIISQIIYI